MDKSFKYRVCCKHPYMCATVLERYGDVLDLEAFFIFYRFLCQCFEKLLFASPLENTSASSFFYLFFSKPV